MTETRRLTVSAWENLVRGKTNPQTDPRINLTDADKAIIDAMDNIQLESWARICELSITSHTGPADHPPYVKAQNIYSRVLERLGVVSLVVRRGS